MTKVEKNVVEFGAGCHISKAAQMLADAADRLGTATGSFNGIVLTVNRADKPDSIVAWFTEESERRAEAYRNSPDGKAAEASREQRRRETQGKHDALMDSLPRVDMRDADAVLAWLEAMQVASDYVDVVVRRKTILSVFEGVGYLPGVNCGADYRGDDRDNSLRYLVGQALDGLANGPAIHPIFHKFAAEWRARFLPSPNSNDEAAA
jgi:hypothetical protein